MFPHVCPVKNGNAHGKNYLRFRFNESGDSKNGYGSATSRKPKRAFCLGTRLQDASPGHCRLPPCVRLLCIPKEHGPSGAMLLYVLA